VFVRDVCGLSRPKPSPRMSLYSQDILPYAPFLYSIFGTADRVYPLKPLVINACLLNPYSNKGGYRPLTPAALMLSALLDFKFPTALVRRPIPTQRPTLRTHEPGRCLFGRLRHAQRQTTILPTLKGGGGGASSLVVY
jgi:hypothetical protein